MTAPVQLGVVPGEHAFARVRATIAQLAMLAGSEGLLRVGNFVLAVIIAREYSPSILGIYAMAVAASTCAVTFADGGLQLSAIRSISADPFNANTVFSRVVASKIVLLPVAVLIAVGILAGEQVSALWIVCALVFLRTLLQSLAQLNYAALKAQRNVAPIAALQYVHFAFMVAVLVAAVRVKFGLVLLLALLVACQGTELLGSTFFLRRRRFRLQRVAWAECRTLIRSSIPTAITTSISTIAFRADLIVLALFVSAEQTGQFAAAQFVMIAMYLASWLLGSLLLPEFAADGEQAAVLSGILRRWTRVLLLLTVPATAALIWIIPHAMFRLFGSAYQESASLISVLLLATPFIWLNSLYLHRAIGQADKKIHVRAYALVTAIAAGVSAVLAWKFGAMGIAGAAVAREAGLFAVLFTMTAGRL